MAREKKATGDAPKKRAPRTKAPVAAAQEETQRFPENGNEVVLNSGNGSSASERGSKLQGVPDDQVRRRAYELWEQRGRQHGKDADDWYTAESEIRGKSA